MAATLSKTIQEFTRQGYFITFSHDKPAAEYCLAIRHVALDEFATRKVSECNLRNPDFDQLNAELEKLLD